MCSFTLTMTLLCATGTSSNVFTLRGRLHLSFCWDNLYKEDVSIKPQLSALALTK